MKLSGFLNKPRWQAKEAAVRRAGVADDDDAELIASLPVIARQDPDPGVRNAAMKRLADPALTQRLAHDDPDAGVRTDARKLWFDLLAGTHARAPSATECARLLRAQDDAALIEHVARAATDVDLRGTALARVTRSALLAERVTGDPAPELRLAALERIDDEPLLERLAERTRKTDKKISRRARERVDALRIARGNSDVAEGLARTLCERMEKLVREPRHDDTAADIDAQWTAIEMRAGDALRARYQAARKLLAASLEAPAPPAPSESATSPEIADATAVPASEATSEPLLETTPEQGEPQAPDADPAPEPAPATTPPETPDAGKPHPDHEQRQARALKVEQAISAFESAVEAGVVAKAHTAHAELGALKKSAGASLPRALQHRLAEAERRYAELSQWQHWGDNQRRRQLCETIEALTGSGLHPDAIATRVREAQAEWSRLDVAEGHAAGGHAVHGWARRFHSACRHALEPAKSYFKKRQELRKTHSQAITAALDEARALPADSTEWARIAKTRHAVVDALRTLDKIDPHERKAFARDLKGALTALDARLTGHHAEIEAAKSALTAEAEALTAGELPRGAVAAARALQQRWRDIGNGRRDRDQAQWRTFRSALDAVFGKLDAERSQRTARETDSRARAAELCAEFEKLASADTPPQRAALTRVENEWDALGVRDDALVRRYRAAHGLLRDAEMRRERESRRGPYDAWLTRYRLCREAEMGAKSADELRTAWQKSPAGEVAMNSLTTRFEAALGDAGGDATAAPSAEPDEEAAREVLIRLEIFAGLESPREDHDRRRELQIERLSARMRGAAALTPQQELAALLVRWTGLAPLPALEARFERDLAAAVGTLP